MKAKNKLLISDASILLGLIAEGSFVSKLEAKEVSEKLRKVFLEEVEEQKGGFIKAKFIGKDGSMGFIKDRMYTLKLVGSLITNPDGSNPCPYGSVEAFVRNWKVLDA